MKKISLLLILILKIILANAQSGGIKGNVRNDTGDPIPGATITIEPSKRMSTTDDAGNFQFTGVPDGIYSLHVSSIGYKTSQQQIIVKKSASATLVIRCKRDPKELPPITITSEKKESILQNTPVTVSALDAKKIKDYQLWSLKDLTAVVPNLFINDGGSDLPFYSIRGVYANSLDQSVAIYVDGVMQYDAETTLRNLYDIERIEILRGPQGTLYGRNALAGVINIITRKPKDVTNGFVEAAIANYGTMRYSAGIKTPIVRKKLFTGITVAFNRSNGYYINAFNHTKFDRNNNVEGNFYLRYLPSSKWILTLNAKAQRTNNQGKFPYIMNDSIALEKGHYTNQDTTGKQSRNAYTASLSLQHTGKWFALTSVTAWQYADKFIHNGLWDGDWTPDDVFAIGYGGAPRDNSSQTFTQEISISNPTESTGKFRWTAGAFYMYHPEKETALLLAGKDATADPYAPYELRSPSSLINSGYALFGQATYKLSPKWDLTAGLRYDREKKHLYTQTDMIKEGMPDMPLVKRTRISGNYNALSPKLSVAFRPRQHLLFYANFAKGFKAGGLNKRTTDPAFYSYNPEYSENIEAGVKSGWLNNRLTANFTVFLINWKDMQVTAFTRSPAETAIRNTGNAITKGIEAELSAIPFTGLTIDYNFSYNHGRYTRLYKPDETSGTEKNLKGNWLIMQPEITSMLAAQYTHPLFRKWEGTVRSEWSYLGKHYFDIENKVGQNPYSLFNVKAGIADRHWDITFWARNILNKRYLSFSYPTGARLVTLGTPATFGIAFTVKF